MKNAIIPCNCSNCDLKLLLEMAAMSEVRGTDFQSLGLLPLGLSPNMTLTTLVLKPFCLQIGNQMFYLASAT